METVWGSLDFDPIDRIQVALPLPTTLTKVGGGGSSGESGLSPLSRGKEAPAPSPMWSEEATREARRRHFYSSGPGVSIDGDLVGSWDSHLCPGMRSLIPSGINARLLGNRASALPWWNPGDALPSPAKVRPHRRFKSRGLVTQRSKFFGFRNYSTIFTCLVRWH